MSPVVSSTAAHTKAEVKFAIWNRQNGISKMPAISGTEARSGPKKRPMKMPSHAPFLHEGFALGDQVRVLRQRPDVLHACIRACWPIQ